MRAELREILRKLTEEELREVRGYIDRLLARLRASGAAPQGAPGGRAEMRRFERYSVDLPLSYFPHSAARRRGGRPALREAVARDLSRSGIRFLAREALDAGERLTLYLPRPAGVRKLLAEVRWCRRRGEGFECGARFVGLERFLRPRQRPAEACEVLLACEPSPQHTTLRDLLVKDGYYVSAANAVPEALEALAGGGPMVVVASRAMLLADGGRLLEACEAAPGPVVTVAVVPTYELDKAENAPLRRCHDHIAGPDRPGEVLMVVERAWRRLMAAAARRAGA